MLVRILSLCILGVAALPLTSQSTTAPTTAIAYDLVAVVKPSHAADNHLRIRMDEDAIYIQNASLRDLLSNTLGLRSSLIYNLPKWATEDRFDIQAKVLSEDTHYLEHMSRAQRKDVFLRLLTERFGLKTHTEERTMPIYELVASGHGLGLVENPPPPAGVTEKIAPNHNGRGNTSVIGTTLDATGVRIADLCANLARILDRNVIDKTGLTSFYDIQLHWTDHTQSTTEESGPSIFTAVQEQLGLKLVASKGAVQVLLVDHATTPVLDE